MTLSAIDRKDALIAAQMGMWEWEVGSDRVSWTEGVELLFGMQPGEFDGSFAMFVSRIPVEDRPLLDNAIKRALEQGEPLVVEHRVVHDNGVTRWVRGQGNTMRDESGRPVKMIGICQDVTERIEEKAALREALERAESANRLKNAILANMSHEIRTPMTAILGYSELLLTQLTSPAESRYAEVINSGGRRLLHLLDSIVDLARIEADKLELTYEAHSLDSALQRICEMMEVLAHRKGLALQMEIVDSLWVWTDPRRLEQVLTNLLSNAIRFTEAGSISVRVDRHETNGVPVARVAIEDTGIGIEKSFLPHAFEEFRQESEGLIRNYEGSGLGLSIVKRLLDAMGGRIAIESERGVGTVVTLHLPLAKAEIGTTLPLSAGPVISHGSRPRLLVVEDEAAIGRLIKLILGEAYDVVWFDSAETALEALSRDPAFDAVLLDIHLKPGRLDGFSAFQLMRSRMKPCPPVLALTAYAMKGDHDRFVNEGFDGYLAKPFDQAQLREALLSLLAKV
jgi:PAS domain S-box-containing protein